MVERLSKAGGQDKRRPYQARSAVYARLMRQEAGKLRFLPTDIRPAEMTFGRFFNSAHVSTRRRFIYIKNDKVGSSFIVRSLNASEKKARRVAYRTPFLARHRHPLKTPAELSRAEWREALATYFIFTFCRNPFSRILSCYLDRIVGRDESYDVLRKRFGFRKNQIPTFAAFLEMLCEDGALDLDTHWKPQHINIATDYYDYSFIGHFEYFGEEFPRVLKMLYGRHAQTGAIRKGTSAARQMSEHYDDYAAGLVAKLYAKDFTLFGYDPARPLEVEPIRRNGLAALETTFGLRRRGRSADRRGG